MKTIADKITESYINNLILPSEPLFPIWNRENFIFRKTAKWNYIDNCMIKAVTMLYEISENNELLDYAIKFIDAYISDGTIPTMRTEDFNLDNIKGCNIILNKIEIILSLVIKRY